MHRDVVCGEMRHTFLLSDLNLIGPESGFWKQVLENFENIIQVALQT